MAGLLVQTGWESREMLVPDQTAHLIPPVWNRITSYHGGWSEYFDVKRGWVWELGFTGKWTWGRGGLQFYLPWSAVQWPACSLTFLLVSRVLPRCRLRGLLKCFLSGPVPALWCHKANRSLTGSLLGMFWPATWVVTVEWPGPPGLGGLPLAPLEVLTCNIVSYWSCRRTVCDKPTLILLWYKFCYSHFSDAENATWWVSGRAEAGSQTYWLHRVMVDFPPDQVAASSACMHLSILSESPLCVCVCMYLGGMKNSGQRQNG